MSTSKRLKEERGGNRRRRRTERREQVGWDEIPREIICELIDAVDRFGGAVRFGRTRDGSSYAVGIYGDGEPYTEYHAGLEGAMEWLVGLTADYNGSPISTSHSHEDGGTSQDT
jgi:hypothetical protein